MSKPKPLFDDAEEQPAALRVNKDFAKRFEHNSKRNELQRLQAKYPDQAAKLEQGADSSSDGEDDDEGLIDERTQAQIFETLLKIRRRDQSIYDAQAKFYSSDSEEEEDEEEAAAAADESGAAGGAAASKQKKEKPMYLKDVIYKQAMEGIVESEEEEEEAAAAARQQPRTYVQEQQQLKQAFLSAFEENVEGAEGAAADGFGAGVLQQRPGKKGSAAAAAAAAAAAGSDDHGVEEGGEGEAEGADSQRVQQLLDGYFGRDHELTQDDQFLKRYIMNKGWVEEGEEEEHYGAGAGEGEEVDDEEDEQFVQQAEQFEHAYNFRFEEPGSSNIVTHPRNIEGTVRKEDDRRKRARAEKAARQAAAEEQRKAEVRRLKNLKRAEIEGKLTEIQSVAGQAGPGQEALDALVGGDFDPDEYDRQMAAAFGDDYYAAEGEEEEEEDAAFERELEAMAAYGSDGEEAEEGGEGNDPQTFAALQKRLAAQRRQQAGGEGEEEGSEEEEEEEGRELDPEAAARVRAEVQRLLEEYYKLNYEDVVGGLPTRFRYKEVAPDTFGLGVEEILGMEDKELNQVVGLKTLAPYREEHRRFRPNYQKLNQLRQQRDEEQGQRHGGGKKAGKQYWEREGQQGQGQKVAKREEERQPRPVKTVAELRLESFAKPVFKKTNQQYEGGREQHAQDGGFKKRKRDEQQQDDGGAGKQKQPKQSKQQQQQQQQQVAGDGAKLSKAAKKNLKRREKRRGKPEAAAA